MRVLDKYLVVEKVVLNTTLHLSPYYIDEYQTCKVISSPGDSIFEKDVIILVGNKICFDKAPDFGSKSYYIDSSEVFGRIENGLIIPSINMVYIRADKQKKSLVKTGSLELFKDITYKPLDTDNVTQDGEVLSVCDKAKHTVFNRELDIDIEPGDHVYCHHFLTDKDNERIHNGVSYYEMAYEHLYCKISEGLITMLNEWNFIEPVVAEIGLGEFGIIKEVKKRNELRVGIVRNPCKKLLSRGVKSGDTIYFKRGREYRINVEGKELYRIETNDILSRYENMEAIGKIVIVKEIKPDNKKGVFLKTVAQNPIPDKGEVISVGDECGSKIKIGDVVLFRKMANTEIEIDNQKLLLMNYDSIYVVL